MRPKRRGLLVARGGPIAAALQTCAYGTALVLFARSAVAQTAPETTEPPGFLGLILENFALGPLGWRGQISDEYSQKRAGGGRSTQHRQTLGLQGNTYLAHPALLSLSGAFTWSTGTTNAVSAEGQSDRTRSSSGSGNLSANGLSLSRYPFSLNYSISDSTVDNILSTSAFRSNLLRYQQSYRPEVGRYQVEGSLARGKTSSSDGDSTTAEYQMGLNAGFGEGHAIRADSAFRGIEDVDGSVENVFSNYFNHSFGLEYYYRVNNTARFLRTVNTDPRIDVSANDQRDAQLFNSVYWLPSDDYPLQLNSGLNVNWRELDGTSSETIGGNLSADYRFNDKVSAVATTIASQTTSEIGSRQRSAALSGSLLYNGDAREFYGFSHNWSASTSATGSRFTGGRSGSVSVGATQSAVRPIKMPPRRSLALYFAQSLARTRTSSNTGDDSITSISHNADLNFAANEQDTDFGATLRVQDQRNRSSTQETILQSMSVSGTGGLQLTRLSTLSADAGFGVTRGRSESAQGSTETGWDQTGSGSVSYRHQRPFGWRQAAYDASFRLNVRDNTAPETKGTVLDRYLFAYTLQHSLTTRIGLLSARLANDYGWDADGNLTWGISFRVSRDF